MLNRPATQNGIMCSELELGDPRNDLTHIWSLKLPRSAFCAISRAESHGDDEKHPGDQTVPNTSFLDPSFAMNY
eukprot:4325418-Alexandrium_andersonii.AAC.1